MLCNLRRFLIRFYRNIHFNIGEKIWKNNIRVLSIPKHMYWILHFYHDENNYINIKEILLIQQK